MSKYPVPFLLQKKMQEYGHSYRSLSQASGIAQSTLYRIFNGHSPVNLGHALMLCDVLKIKPGEISKFFCIEKCREVMDYGA